jgi:hypothetical protein
MTITDIIEEIKLELTGGILELEIDDNALESVIKKALRELERYWDETTLITVPAAQCIDYAGYEPEISSIVRVYRTQGVGENMESGNYNLDPMYAQQWMLFSNGGTMYNLNDYVMNYASWMTLSQIRNTMSTDMAFKDDRHNSKLYISNFTNSIVTIEYVPKLTKVDDIKSDYWKDILIKLSVALTKIVLGRIRTRFTQSNSLWTQDGERMLEEGNTDLKELREVLRTNSNLIYPLD